MKEEREGGFRNEIPAFYHINMSQLTAEREGGCVGWREGRRIDRSVVGAVFRKVCCLAPRPTQTGRQAALDALTSNNGLNGMGERERAEPPSSFSLSLRDRSHFHSPRIDALLLLLLLLAAPH